MTPEELIRKRKRDELLKRANAAQPTTPTDGEQLVSENTKETLKAAGHWAGVIGKRAAELTQKGVAVAAEKAKEAKAQLDAKRAKTAEERVQATEANSSTLTVQPAKVDVAKTFLKTETAGSLVADGMAQDLTSVDGEGREGKAPFAEMAVEDLVEEVSVQVPAAIAGEGDAPLANPSQQDVTESLSVQSELDSPSFEGVSSEVIEEVLAQIAEAGIHDERGFLSPEPPGDTAREMARSVLEEAGYAKTSGARVSDLADDSKFASPLEDPLGEPVPPPDDAYSEEVTQPCIGTDDTTPRRKAWPWLVGGVVAVALVAGAINFLQGKDDQPPPSVPAPVTPVAAPVVPEQVPEVMEAPVVAPAPAVLPEEARTEPTLEKPQPVTAPVLTASAPKEAQPKPSPKRASPPLPKKAPALAAEQKNDWQQKANDDLDAWAEKSGIK
ncbi:hypothetical protein LJR168_002586 [Pseudoxanthomonas sp. LjRoot168]|uniref:hypothetical protein n=1 Tax=unclassified Pseudoxanthomonas TaxID=2645906 RepID=UPI003ED06050